MNDHERNEQGLCSQGHAWIYSWIAGQHTLVCVNQGCTEGWLPKKAKQECVMEEEGLIY